MQEIEMHSPQNAGNALLEAQILKVSRGSMPPGPP